MRNVDARSAQHSLEPAIAILRSTRRRRTFRGALGVLVAWIVAMAGVVPVGASAIWSIVPSPNSGTHINALTDVACNPSGSCTAVGYSFDTSIRSYRTLIETGNGSGWSIVPSPNNGTGDNELRGVSCHSPSSCVAVGFYDSNGVNQTLIESWDGTTWSLAPSPNRGTGYNELDGVSCRPEVRASCQAVGVSYDASLGAQQTLIESWNGTSWSIVPSPSSGTGQNVLYGVSCYAAKSCTAVGYADNSLGGFRTVIESWNGSSWRLVASPNVGTSSHLLSVSCRSSSACQAVGSYDSASVGAGQTLVESWNGTSWSITASPDVGTNQNGFFRVSCSSPSFCEAVGLYFNTGVRAYQTLIESWNGSSWSIVPSPNNGTAYNILEGVSCRPAGRSCTAVGGYYNTNLGTYRSLIESNA